MRMPSSDQRQVMPSLRASTPVRWVCGVHWCVGGEADEDESAARLIGASWRAPDEDANERKALVERDRPLSEWDSAESDMAVVESSGFQRAP